jgi:hypothetical protein
VAPTYGCPEKFIKDGHQKGSDCSDLDPSSHPGGAALCDGIDHACSTHPWEGCPSTTATFGTVQISGLYGLDNGDGCGGWSTATATASCATGGIVGLSGYFGGNFAGPTQLTATCSDATINAAPSSPEYTYTLGRSGSTWTSTAGAINSSQTVANSSGASCNSGDWVVGVIETNSCLGDLVTLLCAPISYVRCTADCTSPWVVTTGATYRAKVGGRDSATTGWAEQTFQCAPGSVLTQITEWYANSGGTNQSFVSGYKYGCKPLGYTPQ